jgi:hypothetical protein
VLVFGATLETRRRTFREYQNRANAPARQQSRRAHYNLQLGTIDRKWNFFVNGCNAYVSGVGPTGFVCGEPASRPEACSAAFLYEHLYMGTSLSIRER